MSKQPLFASARAFAKIAGRSQREISSLCRQQIIPNEKLAKGFRIPVQDALDELRRRASEFQGHQMMLEQVPFDRPVFKAERPVIVKPPKLPKGAPTFRERLKLLAKKPAGQALKSEVIEA